MSRFMLLTAAALFLVPLATAAQHPDDAPADPDWRYLETKDDRPAATRARDDLTARTPAMILTMGNSTSVQVNTDGNGNNITGDAANESSIAVDPIDPDNIVIGWRQFDNVSSNFRQAGWAFSSDGGETWTAGTLNPGFFRSDPSLGFNALGDVYYMSLDGNFLVQFFKSSNGGVSWGPAVDGWGGDKNWMTVDNSGGEGDGHVYGAWQRFFSCCDPDTLTRSTDDGQSFEFPAEIDDRPLFGTMAVGPEGTLYVSGVDGSFGQDFDTFVLARSTNAQDSAQTPSFSSVVVSMGGPMRIASGPNPGGLLGQANVAADPVSDNVYLVASTNPPGADPLDVRFSRSTDGGVSWSSSVRVNNDPQGSGRWQWFAAHDVAPNGRIDVVWYDTRNSVQNNISELFYAWSYDEGQSWQGNEPVSPSFDSHVGWPNQDKIGDYITVKSMGNGAHVAYAATFNGEQDVYYTRLFPDCTNGGSGSAFCFGDGTGTACPCSNSGAPGHGCANGETAGAQLSACGNASVGSGNLQLQCTGVIATQVGLYFQGDVVLNGGNGHPFRDGLRCTGSSVVRLEVISTDFAGNSQSTVDLATAGNVGAGDTKHYQLWYRDPSSSPCATGSNLSNGYTIAWAP